jgi:ATP/ADP translocase/HEAT repeat protein
MTRLLGVRREDGRTVAAAFATLLTIIASHAVLETARDTLFLTHLSASMLPWAYLAMASLAFVVAQGSALVATRSPRRVLTIVLAVGAVGTGAFAWIVETPSRAALMALYVWTGLLASVVVAQFWVELAGRMDVGQAKRGYTVVAAGGMLGAMLGSLLAGGILTVAGPQALLPAAAALFACAACLPAFTSAGPWAPRSVPTSDADERPGLATVWADPYTKRMLLLAVIAPVVTMTVDFVFKSIVSQEVPKADLGPFFARYNAIVNGAALAVQLTVAPHLLQSFGVVRILCLLPGALGLVAAGVAGATALPAAVVLRGTDGTLRHSLHRAATEILFLPLPAATRSALRGFVESIGQRGGQVLGSVAILVAVGVGAAPRDLAIGVALLCGVWLLGYLRLQDHYVQRFRSQLRSLGAVTDVAVPALDLRSVETLVTSLGSENDGEVIAAIDLLETYGRERLVSPLILYHPSAAVVLRALDLFDDMPRDDLRQLRRRLLEHPEASVRAAALRRLVADGCDRSIVRASLKEDASPLVRHTALVLWMGYDDTPPSDLEDAVADLLASPDPSSRLAVASTLGELPPVLLMPVARAILEGATLEIRRTVACSLAAQPDPASMPLLTELLAVPECRAYARAALHALGEPALEHLALALEDGNTPAAVRRHLPRTMSRFASPRAAEILVARLAHERDGRVAYKILRGLGRMRMDDPTLPVDRTTLMTVAERTLERLVELLAYRVAYDLVRTRPVPNGEGPKPAAHAVDLLERLLVEKEGRALERVFRILQILEPSEDFATIFEALAAETSAVRATGRELIGHILEGRFRDALLALTDSLPAGERLRVAASELEVPMADEVTAAWRTARKTDAAAAVAAVRPVLARLEADHSVILASVARHCLRPDAGAAPEGARVAS